MVYNKNNNNNNNNNDNDDDDDDDDNDDDDDDDDNNNNNNNSLHLQQIKVHISGYISRLCSQSQSTLKIILVKLQMHDKTMCRNYIILCLKINLFT